MKTVYVGIDLGSKVLRGDAALASRDIYVYLEYNSILY